MTDREMLMEDRDAMEDAMSAIEHSAGAELWQNRLIWRMCKAINDLLIVIGKMNMARFTLSWRGGMVGKGLRLSYSSQYE